jgi:hypothetical protein
LYIFKAPFFKQSRNGRHLTGVCFEKEAASWVEVFRRAGDKGPDKIQTVLSAVQGQPGFPPDFRGQAFDIPAGDVGGVGNDQVETFRDTGKEIAFNKAQPRTPMDGGIL